jgi:hypothetical protein
MSLERRDLCVEKRGRPSSSGISRARSGHITAADVWIKQSDWKRLPAMNSVPPDDETARRESSSTRDSGRRDPATFDAGAPELEAISRLSLDNPSAPKEAIPDRFACQKWHRPYAEALIEKDPARRASLVREARRAILARYLERYSELPLEFPLSTMQSDETCDLWNAVIALSEL